MDAIGLGVLQKFYYTELQRSYEGLINSAINQVNGKINIGGGILNDSELNKVVAILYRIEQRLKAVTEVYSKIKMSLNKSNQTKSSNKKLFFVLSIKDDEERQLKLILDHVNKMEELKLSIQELERFLSTLREEQRKKIVNKKIIDENLKSIFKSIIKSANTFIDRYNKYLDMLGNNLLKLSSTFNEIINEASDEIFEVQDIIDTLSRQEGMEDLIEAYKMYQEALEYVVESVGDVALNVSSVESAITAQHEYYTKNVSDVHNHNIELNPPIKISQVVKANKLAEDSSKYANKIKEKIREEKGRTALMKERASSGINVSKDEQDEIIKRLKSAVSLMRLNANQASKASSEIEIKYNKNDDSGARLR